MVCDGSASGPETGCNETNAYSTREGSSAAAVGVVKNCVYGTLLFLPVTPFTTRDKSCVDLETHQEASTGRGAGTGVKRTS